MNIHQKINYRNNAIFYLNFNQFMQLVNHNRIVLAPYYNERLKKQSKIVEDAENFKSIYGKYRYEYENNI